VFSLGYGCVGCARSLYDKASALIN
jgi:hypothetical protein